MISNEQYCGKVDRRYNKYISETAKGKESAYFQEIYNNYPFSLESKQLLNFRKIPYYAKLCGLNERKRLDAMIRIHSLQEAIYDLDSYGEKNWFIDRIRINEIWEKIDEEIDDFDIRRSSIRYAIEDLKKYQEIEIHLRERQFPLDVPLLEFYKTKTCDIRLERAIIEQMSQSGISRLLNEAWLLFDIISEVQDDLEDYWEDLGSYNFNRIQTEVYFYGVSHTFEKYIGLIKTVEQLSYGLERKARTEEELKVICLVRNRILYVYDNLIRFFNSGMVETDGYS